MARFALALGLSLALAGCACGGPGDATGPGDDDDDIGDCSDLDGDGYGTGAACEGPDCDDTNPDVWTEAQCEALCDVDPHATGCDCSSAEFPEPEICYAGPEGTLGVGICRAGLRTCVDGAWTPCNGQQLPGMEVCDDVGVDEDCDGEINEGVTNECGTCDPDCEENCIGVGCDDPFDPGAEGASGVVLTPEGGLTLDSQSAVVNHVIWIANSSQGTVTKINTRTREEEGRYRTGPDAAGSPSRTSVNYQGDVAVANRSGRGELTRYKASDCEDSNRNGRIDTSSGAGDVYAWMEDECFVWSTEVEPVSRALRGTGFEYRVGLDGVLEEYIWTGSTSSSTVHEVDAEDGELTGRSVNGLYPYGLAIGPDNKVWTFNSGASRGIVEWTTTDDDLEKTLHPYAAGCGQYGITVDSHGRVWVGGSVCRYNPDDDEWEGPIAAIGSVGGIAVDGDDNAWTGELDMWGAQPVSIDAETLEVSHVISHVGGHGWAVDFDGYVWCVPFVGARAYVVDPDTMEQDGVVEGLIGAYTYSDMTGFQLINATNPIGIFPHVFDSGCESEVTWSELHWEAVVPARTSLTFRVKTANDLVALAAAPLIVAAVQPPDASPVDLEALFAANGVTPGRLLYVEATLQSISREDAPILNSFRATHSCGFIVE